MDERIIAEIRSKDDIRLTDLEMSSQMTVNRLIRALHSRFSKDLFSDPQQNWLRSEYPAAFLYGERTLAFYRLRRGSVIYL